MMKVLLLIWCLTIAARAGTVVAPNGVDSIEGDTKMAGFLGGGEGTRNQIIYGSQNFSLFPPEGAYITALRFRMDGQYPSGFSGAADIEIRFSTTHQDAEALNPTFANNIGPDETLVLPRTTVPLSSGAIPGGPNAFSIVIPLPTKFYYKPANGNLLLDGRIYAMANVFALDAQTGNFDGLSGGNGSLNSPTVTPGVIYHSGPITQFEFVPVPEPSAVISVFFGLGIALLAKRRKNVTT